MNVGLTRRRVAPKRHTASVPSEDRGLLLELAYSVKARSAQGSCGKLHATVQYG